MIAGLWLIDSGGYGMLVGRAVLAGGVPLAEGLEQAFGAGAEHDHVGRALEEREAHLDSLLDLGGVGDGAADGEVVLLGGGDHLFHGGAVLGVVLIAAEAEGIGEVVGADEEHVDAGGGGELLDLFDGGGLLNDDDGEGVFVDEIGVAFGGGPAEGGESGAGAAAAGGGIFGAGGGLAGEFRGGREGEDDADGAHVEGAFGGPELIYGDADEGECFEAAGGEDHVARGFEGDGTVLHFDPDEIEAHGGALGGDFGAGGGDGGADDGFAFLEQFAHGVFPWGLSEGGEGGEGQNWKRSHRVGVRYHRRHV